MSVKIERINNMLVEEISYILATEIKDEDIKFVTITGANTTNDLSFAKIYFTTLKEKEKTLEALNNASGFIRKMLADRIEIRHIPELTFIYDESIEYGKRIEQIIKTMATIYKGQRFINNIYNVESATLETRIILLSNL